MADSSGIIDKIEGLVGLALLVGVAYVALKFGPGIVAAFKDAGKAARDVLSPKSAVSTHADAVRDAVAAEQRAREMGDDVEADRQHAISYQEAYKSVVDASSMAFGWNPILQASTRFAGDLAVDTALGRGATAGAPATGTPQADAVKSSSASAVSFLSGQPAGINEKLSGQAADRNFDANLAKKQAEWQAAQDARTEAVKLLVQERNTARANEREAQRIKNEEQYNAWLRSTKPASESVADFLNAGKQYQGQQEVAPGVYVAPSGAYQVIQNGQIVAGGSAGAVQAALTPSVQYSGQYYAAPGTAAGGKTGRVYSKKAAKLAGLI